MPLVERLVEPVRVQDVFVSGLADLHDIGGSYRLVFYVQHFRFDGMMSDIQDNVIAAKIIIPGASLMHMIDAMHRGRCHPGARGLLPH